MSCSPRTGSKEPRWSLASGSFGRSRFEAIRRDTFSGCLDALQRLPFEVRWSHRFIIEDYQQSEALLRKEQRRWQQKSRSFASQIMRTEGRLDHHAVERANELDAALGDLNAGAVLYGHHTSVLVLSGKDPAEIEERCALVERVAQRAGYIAHRRNLQRSRGFHRLASRPHPPKRPKTDHSQPELRRPRSDFERVGRRAHLSLALLRKGSPALAVTRSSSGARFHLNLHVGDVGHTLMLGPTGAGKSTLLAYLASQFLRYESQGAQIFAFDKGRSLLPLCASVTDAAHVDFGTDVPELCPLQDLSSPKSRAWAAEWIEQLLSLQGLAIDSSTRPQLIEALQTFSDTSGGGSLTDFVTTLQDASMRTALGYYASEGPGGAILDGERTELPNRRFTVFEIEDLMNMGPKIVDATLLYLFHFIETKLDGRPTLLLARRGLARAQ